MSAIKRNFRQAVAHIGDKLEELGVGADWRVYVTHAAVPDMAHSALQMLKERFPDSAYEIHLLTPAFITQGGPGCVAIQAIREL